MAGKTPEEARDAFIAPIRSSLACITSAAIVTTGSALDRTHSITLRDTGQTVPNRARLRTHDGEGEIIFRFAHQYRVVPREAQDDGDDRGLFQVRSAFYQYRILDVEETEIIVYDWHPIDDNPATFPHMHVSIAGSVMLRQRSSSRYANVETLLSKFHLPTSRICIEDIVWLLIREFRVVPRRPDWEGVIAANRNAIDRSS